MKTYHVACVVRPDDESRTTVQFSEERIFQGRIEAERGVHARRGVMDHVRRKGLLVSYFLSVELLDKEVER